MPTRWRSTPIRSMSCIGCSPTSSRQSGRAPSCLGDVDVVLTATYVTLGQDLLTGQVDPRTVSQDWHIQPTPAQVDSALGRFLSDTRFDVSLTQMRPEYQEYKDLQKQLTRYRQIIAQGRLGAGTGRQRREAGRPWRRRTA